MTLMRRNQNLQVFMEIRSPNCRIRSFIHIKILPIYLHLKVAQSSRKGKESLEKKNLVTDEDGGRGIKIVSFLSAAYGGNLMFTELNNI